MAKNTAANQTSGYLIGIIGSRKRACLLDFVHKVMAPSEWSFQPVPVPLRTTLPVCSFSPVIRFRLVSPACEKWPDALVVPRR